MNFTYLKTGAVLCSADHGNGRVAVMCADLDLSLEEREQTAREQVQELLTWLSSGEE